MGSQVLDRGGLEAAIAFGIKDEGVMSIDVILQIILGGEAFVARVAGEFLGYFILVFVLLVPLD